MKKALVAWALGALIVRTLFADGMAHYRGSVTERWTLLGEEQQSAVIHFHKGRQAMLLAIDLKKAIGGGTAVWLFPVPAGPENVAIDILQGDVEFFGYDLESKFDEDLASWTIGGAAYSAFPMSLLPVSFFDTWGPARFLALGEPGFLGVESAMERVVVHQSKSKLGLTIELITTRDREAFARYLKEKGLDLPPPSMGILDGYIEKDYSFVVSFGSQAEAPAESRLSVFVSFPTKKIYFPLKPTSVYGESLIPIRLMVVGHVRPELFARIKGLTTVTYYSGRLSLAGSQGPVMLGRDPQSVRGYSEVMIHARAKSLSEDLWMKDSPPLRIRLLAVMEGIFKSFALVYYLVCSMLASLAAARLSFRTPPMPPRRMLAHGLWNCLTMVAFIPASLALSTLPVPPHLEEEARKCRARVKVKDIRKAAYVLLFYVFFLVLYVTGMLGLRLILL